jgi:long-chain acyl-CoA synthetase
MFNSPVRRLFSRLFNVFPVDARRARSALAFGRAVLERGNALAWFPEGRRSEDGRLETFETGIGRLVQDKEVALVPVHIEGTHTAWPVRRNLPRPAQVCVRFGRPIDP